MAGMFANTLQRALASNATARPFTGSGAASMVSWYNQPASQTSATIPTGSPAKRVPKTILDNNDTLGP